MDFLLVQCVTTDNPTIEPQPFLLCWCGVPQMVFCTLTPIKPDTHYSCSQAVNTGSVYRALVPFGLIVLLLCMFVPAIRLFYDSRCVHNILTESFK